MINFNNMPYLLSTSMEYKDNKYVLRDLSDLIRKFPFLQDKIVVGRVLSAYIDGKITKIERDFECKIIKDERSIRGEIINPLPLKEKGIPPCDLLIIFYKYLEKEKEYPIMEGMVLSSSISPSYFDDEIKRILKEEEIKITLESIVFHSKIAKRADELKEAYLLFEQENFSSTKTSCRKVIEKLREIVSSWESIDGSKSLCEKLKQMAKALYSFASVGGPHEGIVTREETELILKTTHSLLLYINSILKMIDFKRRRRRNYFFVIYSVAYSLIN